MSKAQRGWKRISKSGQRKIETAVKNGWSPGRPAFWFFRKQKDQPEIEWHEVVA